MKPNLFSPQASLFLTHFTARHVVRFFLPALTLCSAGCATVPRAPDSRASAGPPPTKEVQAETTPAQTIRLLKEGNTRFAEGRMHQRDWMDQVRRTSVGQYPSAAVVSCIDSRVPVELIFDQGLGNVFGARLAGNIINEDVLGSLEYATEVAGTDVIVILGHTHCGGIKGAVDGVELGNLTSLLKKIEPAVAEVRQIEGPFSSKNGDLVHKVTEANVRHSMKQIRQSSAILNGRVEDGSIHLVGAIYDLDTGRVSFLEE